MNRELSHRWVEALENRRLMSASPDALALDSLVMQTPSLIIPQVATPNIVGTFIGTGTSSTGSSVGTLTIQVTSQSRRGTLMGMVTTKSRHQHSYTYPFTGKIVGDSVKLTTYNGDDTTCKGTVSGRHGNVIAGTYSNPNGNHGNFSVTRTR